MEKLNKYKKHILMAVLIIAGIAIVVFTKNVKVQGGFACLCLGLAIFVAVWINRGKQNQVLIDFDIQANEILEDIALMGADSEYYSYYNIDIIKNLRAKMLKKHKKQTISCALLGVVLLITAIICIV